MSGSRSFFDMDTGWRRKKAWLTHWRKSNFSRFMVIFSIAPLPFKVLYIKVNIDLLTPRNLQKSYFQYIEVDSLGFPCFNLLFFGVCVGGGAIRIINDPISFSSAGSRQPGLHCCLSGKPERGGHRLLLPHQKVLHTHIKIIMIIETTIITIDITIIKVQQKVLHTQEKFTWNFCVRIHQIFQFLGSSQY